MPTFRWPDLPMTTTGTAATTGTNSDGNTTLAVANDTTTLAVPNGTKLSGPTDPSVWISKTVSRIKKRSASDATLVSVTSTKRDGKLIFEAENGGTATDILEAGINMHYIVKKQKLDKELQAAKEYKLFIDKADDILAESMNTYTNNTAERAENSVYYDFHNSVRKELTDATETVTALEKKAALLPIQAEIVMIKAVMEKRKQEKASANSI